MSQAVIALFSIILLDLVLSGDNAAVIGLAICRLPARIRRRAAFVGALAAIGLRIVFTIFTTLLLRIPYFSAAGGIMLLFITWHLLSKNSETNSHVQAKSSFWPAVLIIVLADLSMAFDNMLAVAGAAGGNPWLVIFGLACSIPLLVVGASWISRLINRYPLTLWLGGAVLAHTAISLILKEQALPLGAALGSGSPFLSWGIAFMIFCWGYMRSCRI